MASRAKEASDVSISGRGSCEPIPQRQKELHMEAVAVEGTTHERYSSGNIGHVHRR